MKGARLVSQSHHVNTLVVTPSSRSLRKQYLSQIHTVSRDAKTFRVKQLEISYLALGIAQKLISEAVHATNIMRLSTIDSLALHTKKSCSEKLYESVMTISF